MADFRFDGALYDEAEIGKALLDAARGFARTDDPSQEGDPAFWASRLIEAAIAAGLGEAAGRGIARLLMSEDGAELDLGIGLQRGHRLVSIADTQAAMARLRARGDWARVRALAAPLAALVLAQQGGYDRALRDLAVDADTREKLMKLFLRFDSKWVALNVKALLGGEAAQAESLMFFGLRGLSRAEVEAAARDLSPVLPSLPKDVAQAVRGQLQQALTEAR